METKDTKETTETKTKMVAEKKVKIRLVRDAIVNGVQSRAGTEHEVSQEDSQELCRPIQGPYDFSDYRSNSAAPRCNCTRAVRV